MRRGAALSALLAAILALPAAWLPFLSDDWVNLNASANGIPWRTPFGYVRPLYLASYWLDQHLFGLRPAWFHLVNVLLVACAAYLVVVLIGRYTGDERLAGWSGILFALHPWHVDSVAWIAARADTLYSVLLLLSALAYDRWRATKRGLPMLSLALFEWSLLCKESAVALPALILFVGMADPSRRPDRREMLRGLGPLGALALAHFLVVRPLALGGLGLSLLEQFGVWWLYKLLGYATASFIPLSTDILEARPYLWGAAGAVVFGALIACARRWDRRRAMMAMAAAAAFLILLAPSLISFQERYHFLPGAAAALGLAVLFSAMPRRLAVVAASLLGALWLTTSGLMWPRWFEAAVASENLVAGLAAASSRPGAREIVVANLPHRVRGVPVIGDMESALALSGGRRMPVILMAYIDYPDSLSDGLDETASEAVRYPPPDAEVRLRVPKRLHSGYVWPRLEPGQAEIPGPAGVIKVGPDPETIRITVHPAPDVGRVAYVWRDGHLHQLF